jgi:hypothetical protein
MVCVGDDWAEDHHDVELVDDNGHRLARARLPEGTRGHHPVTRADRRAHVAEWADLDPAEAVAKVKIGIETDRVRGYRH